MQVRHLHVVDLAVANRAEVDAVAVGRAVVEHRVDAIDLDGGDVQVDAGGDGARAGLEEAAARVGEEADHALADAEVPQGLRDEHVGALGQLDAVGAVVEELDAVIEAVDRGDLAGEVDDRPLLDREHARRAGLAGEVGEQAGAGPDVDDDVTRSHDLADRLAQAGRRGRRRRAGSRGSAAVRRR